MSSNVPNKSSQLDFKLWSLPHISTDAIQATIDAKPYQALSSEVGPKGHKY